VACGQEKQEGGPVQDGAPGSSFLDWARDWLTEATLDRREMEACFCEALNRRR
jgi:hypothetical protein